MSRTARDAAAAFADAVYADQQWVDAEFAGIVAASLGEPPAPPPPAPPRVPPRPEPRCRLMLPDTQDEHDGVTHYEHLDTGVPVTLVCGDARGVAGMLTPAALLAVASVMRQAWLP